MIADAMEKVGKEGVISEEGKSMTTELEITEGMRFDRLHLSLLCYRSRADGGGSG